MRAATVAVMDVLGCERVPYRLFRQDHLDYPDVCNRHGNVWDQQRDVCEVAEMAASAALGATA